MKPIHIDFPPEIYSLVVGTLLFSYKDWSVRLADARKNKNAADEKEALSALKFIGTSVQALVGRLYQDPSFIRGLAEHSKIYKLDIDPAKIISDILSGRYKSEHPEAN